VIDLLPSDEQQQIIDGARALLADRTPVDRLRSVRQGDPGEQAWPELVAFGWFLFGLPEAAGGFGAGVVEEVLLAREAGRVLLQPAVLATTWAAHAAADAGDPALVEALGGGAARAGFAVQPAAPDSGWLLVDATAATHVVQLGEAVKLWPIEAFADRRAVSAVDDATDLLRAQLRPGAEPVQGAAEATRRATLLLAAGLVGLAEATLELAVEYAKVREQFGRPIGGFQAIKHRCADMAVRAETAGAQLAMAALAEAERLEDSGLQIWSAALSALQAGRENGAACIQVHGGMGFTWECHAHRYMKRAQLFSQLLGGPRAVEARLLEQPAATL
jgi:alkylation response protein AidB-like acyl-CoA dehydrogenase